MNIQIFIPEVFRFPVEAVIRDKKIATLNVMGKVGLLIYFLVMFFNEENYMVLHVPNVFGQLWSSQGEYHAWEDKLLDGSRPEYCNDSSYNWVDPEDEYYKHIEGTCVAPMFYEMFKTDGTSIFYITYFHEAAVTDEPCEDFDEDACGVGYLEYYTFRDLLNKTCTCETIRNYFTVGVEDIVMVLEHEYSIDEINVNGHDASMLTVVRDYTGQEVATHTGSEIYYTVGQWLEWANIDLDDFNENAADHSGEHPTVEPTATHPRLRQTGARILLDLRYYNTKAYQSNWRGSSTVAYIDVSAVHEWQSIGSDVRYIEYPTLPEDDETEYFYTDSMKFVNRHSYGISFAVSGSGYVGEVDWTAIQGQIIDLLCLLGFVPGVVVLVATYCFGFKSEIFRGQLKAEIHGEVKDMNDFRLLFSHLFKEYWTKKYVLTFEQLHRFCEDRSISLQDEISIRDGVLFHACQRKAGTEKLTAQMFWCNLQDPDPEGLKKFWGAWEEDYELMKKREFQELRRSTITTKQYSDFDEEEMTKGREMIKFVSEEEQEVEEEDEIDWTKEGCKPSDFMAALKKKDDEIKKVRRRLDQAVKQKNSDIKKLMNRIDDYGRTLKSFQQRMKNLEIQNPDSVNNLGRQSGSSRGSDGKRVSDGIELFGREHQSGRRAF